MNERIKSDIERFRQAAKDNAEAQRCRVEWSDKETRTQKLMIALLQLIADGSAEAEEDLPTDILNMAMTYLPNQGISNAVLRHLQALQQRKPEQSGPPQSAPEPELPSDNKTEFVRQYIKRHSVNGVTPAQIKKAATSLGVPGLNTNFPHTILWKLKDAGTIREESGRYFPAFVE
jgi:hypothetical protein